MANRGKVSNANNHARQLKYLNKGIVMLPTLAEERGKRRRTPRRRPGPNRDNT